MPKLRSWQKLFMLNAKNFNVLVIHRRAGKTLWSILYLIIQALKKPGYYWYIAPTYKQAKNIAFDLLSKYTKRIEWTEVNIAELKITLINWSKIQLFGADNPDSLRWLDLKGVIFDEYAQQPSNIYSEIIYPMIIVNKWWVIWIWTPKGKNAFYELYKRAKKDDDFFVLLQGIKNTWLLSEEQIKQAKKEMTLEEFDQEFNCSWNAAIKGAYYSKELEQAREEWRIRKWIYDKLLPVYTFWDLGVSDYTAIVFTQVIWNEIRIIDYYQNNWQKFEFYSDILRQKWYRYEKHYFPHDIAVREFTTWLSRLEIAYRLFWRDKVEITPNIPLKDWIEALRLNFYKLYFDEDKTESLIELLVNYTQDIDKKTWMFKDAPKHDWTSHGADAMRYMAVNYNKLIKQEETNEILVPDYGI